jgi:hypothetical protein
MKKRKWLKYALATPFLLGISYLFSDNSEKLDPFSCGPIVISSTLRELDYSEDYSLEQISGRRWGREPIRNLFSLFDKEAYMITWPWEMKRIFEEYGYNAREESNPLLRATQNEKTRLEKIAEKELEKGNHVIVQTFSLETDQRHWEIYNQDAFSKSQVYSILIVSE